MKLGDYKNLLSMRFGRLSVIAHIGLLSGRDRCHYWQCLCDCGNVVSVRSSYLLRGCKRSCGCLKTEAAQRVCKKKTVHGMCGTPTYNSWAAMIKRCTNPKFKSYSRYGGRGIKVCERWMIFANFLLDMGERPDGMSIDRYPNNDGDYELGNCRWATNAEQHRNTSRNRMFTLNGETMCRVDWEKRLGISNGSLSKQSKSGWPTEVSITTKSLRP